MKVTLAGILTSGDGGERRTSACNPLWGILTLPGRFMIKETNKDAENAKRGGGGGGVKNKEWG